MTIRKLSPAAVLSILGITAIILFLIVSASGFRGLLPGSNLYKSKGNDGFYVFYRLLEELDYNIEFETMYSLPEGTGNSIVYLEMNETSEPWRNEISDWVSRGNELILFENAVDIFFNRETVKEIRAEQFIHSGHSINISRVFHGSFLKGLIKKKILAESESGVIIVKTESGRGSILLIADKSLFNNQNLHQLTNAVLLENLFYPYKKHSIFLREKVSESVFDPSLIKGILQGKLKYITIHLILIFLLFLLMTGKRFSRPELLTGKKRRKISEHIEATGLFYQRARAYSLIEKTDSEYFKVVVCKNQKPAILNSDEYDLYTISDTHQSEDEIFNKFRIRNALIDKIRSRNND